MRLRCLFIIMRMKISSVWLLAVWSGARARALPHLSPFSETDRNYKSHLERMRSRRNWNSEFVNARNSLLLSLFHLASSTVTQKEQEITFHYLLFAPEVIRSLDTVIPPLLFSPAEGLPLGGVHSHNGFSRNIIDLARSWRWSQP